MGDGHVLAQTTHHAHLIAVNCVDDGTGAEEQAGLEHGVGEEVEHRGHVAQRRVIVDCRSMVSGQTSTQCHHHKGDLRNGGEGQYALDVALGTSHGSGIESGERTYPYHDGEAVGSIFHPHGEHAGDLEYTGHDHCSGVNQGRNRSRAFHRIGQPNVEGEHGTLTRTADEHQYQGAGNEETGSGNLLADSNGDESSCSFAHLHCTGE